MFPAVISPRAVDDEVGGMSMMRGLGEGAAVSDLLLQRAVPGNLISRALFPLRSMQQRKISVTKLSFVLTITAVLAGAAPATAQQQPAPTPPDQGNGNWEPPPVTKPTTQH